MKRIQEKVKDLIEVRSYESLRDFISNLSVTLNNYHFTDVTADMMANWLDAAAEIQPQKGAAKALAGYRGVGKSHFLATFAAIVGNPELRSGISEPHVSSSAERLKRRRHPTAFVRRGTHPSLFQEIKEAVAVAFNQAVSELSDSLPELLKDAAQKAGDLPFVLIVDTALEREARVVRDDGATLGEIAEIAKSLNIFLAVALDDDIAGADGVNAAITLNYTIDYLDQEHLYRIVDKRLFPKHRQTQALLHEIYTHFSQALPAFRWSEQRFAALYPLHPIILEIAPFVRLYMQDFTLLGFAAETGGKTLNRPADSLVALDEVFDRTETNLRKVEDLKELFAVYDRINAQVIGQIPVMQRLQAKLVLKALLLLSLDGEGRTAAEISSAMLIYDENEPERAVRMVADFLEKFAASFPELILPQADSSRETRFCFRIGGKDSLNQRLGESIQNISPEVIQKVLRRFSQERFSDWASPADVNAPDLIESELVWRGGARRVNVVWNWKNETLQTSADDDFLDFEINVVSPNFSAAGENFAANPPKIFWRPAELRKEEEEAVLRFYALLTDAALRQQFGDQIRAAGQAHTVAVEKIWRRVFLDEGRLSVDGQSLSFTEEAKSAASLSELLALALEPVFEALYPYHPYFAGKLGKTEVESLVNNLFGGTGANLTEVQQLAGDFALPLGLVAQRGEDFVLETEENLIEQPLAKEVLSMVEQGAEESVSLKKVYRHLHGEPFGLGREAQQLLLVALVAQRQIEFVTSNGNRINHRSLDLKIIWDDVEGIAEPLNVGYSSERLTVWARILTGSNDFRSINSAEDAAVIKDALKTWLSDWQKDRILERFNELPDETLNTRIWRLFVRTEKSFGAVAGILKAVNENVIQLEEGLQRVADTFSDREEEFITRTDEAAMLRVFLDGAARREQIYSYLAVCEPTGDAQIEDLRKRLWQMIEDAYVDSNEEHNQEIEILWQTFAERYSEHFAAKHDAVMNARHLQEQFDEITRSEEWREFESLSRQPVFRPAFWQEAQENYRRFQQLNCRLNVRELLKKHPFCACSFNLAQMREWEKLPERLQDNINRGRASYRRTLAMISETLIPLLEQIAESSGELAPAANKLAQVLRQTEIPLFSNEQLIVIEKALQKIPQNSQAVQAGNN